MIVKKFGFMYIFVGDFLCVVVVVGIDVGKKVKEYMDRGDFVFNEVVVIMVKDCLV